MEKEKTCLYCNNKFMPRHGNFLYCSPEHAEHAKKERQKQRRDPVARLIALLMDNHETFEWLDSEGISELTSEDLEVYGLDISLCQHLEVPLGYEGKLVLSFGEYFLLPDANFQTFKIHKHEAITTTESD